MLTKNGCSWNEVEGSKMSLMQDSIKMALDLLIIRVNYSLGRWTIQKDNSVESKKER